MTGSRKGNNSSAHGNVWIGDLLLALAETRVGDAESCMNWAVEMMDLPKSLKTIDLNKTVNESVSGDKLLQEQKSEQQSPSRQHDINRSEILSDRPIPYEIVNSQLEAESSQVAGWLDQVPGIPEVTDAQIELRPHLEPLFSPKTSRALISTAFATRRDEGEIDFVKLLDQITSLQPVTQLPRLPVSTMRFGVQLLIDRGQGNNPFYGDQEIIQHEILGVVGRDRVETLYFSDSPLRGLGPGSRSSWKRPYEPPAAGTAVVMLTDLGIARRRSPDIGATEEEWLHFSETVRDAGCPLLALVPYGKDRWPKALQEAMYILSWDRGTNVSLVRKTVGHGLEMLAGR